MQLTEVDRIYEEAISIVEKLQFGGEPSLASSADDHLRKSLLLAAASYFERVLTECLIEYVRRKSDHDEIMVSMTRTKVVSRNYHQWFSWTEKNANTFYSIFGQAFKQKFESLHNRNSDYKAAVISFLELGNERNKLVHQNYATFPLDKNLKEIYDLYKRANLFPLTIVEEFAK